MAILLTEVCHDVQVQPDLQPLTGEVLASATSVKTEVLDLTLLSMGFGVAGMRKHTWT